MQGPKVDFVVIVNIKINVFLNRGRTHIKLLHWEHGGFVLYYKRLEQGTFPTPKKEQLSWACKLPQGSSVNESGPLPGWYGGASFYP
ncbi:IS66 family insertion sequence element accessory protein TnpB [Arcticibacter tournemirensis]